MTTGLPDATYWTGTDLEREYGKGYGPEDDLEAERCRHEMSGLHS